jgi:ArsR family transcriptional regulator
MSDERMAEVARALAHPARVRILRLLAAEDACMGGEIFARLPLAQSTVSQHLAVLKDAELIHATPQGTRMVYCIAARPLAELEAGLGELLARHPVCTAKGD